MQVFTVIEDGKGEKEHSEKIVWILLPKNIKMDKHDLQFSMANCNLCLKIYMSLWEVPYVDSRCQKNLHQRSITANNRSRQTEGHDAGNYLPHSFHTHSLKLIACPWK